MSRKRKEVVLYDRNRKRFNMKLIRENLQLVTLTVPTLVLVFLFSYLPMFGIVLPFKDYKVKDGIWGSAWTDPLFKNFEFFITSNDAGQIVRNTLGLNFMFIVVGYIAAVVCALLLFEVQKAVHVKIYQTLIILPNFLSWVAVSYILYGMLETRGGIVNQIIQAFGAEGISWYTEAKYWPVILLIVNLWHNTGMSCILYYASLMGIDTELFEAAAIDGASRLQQIRHISIPHLMGISLVLFILNMGGIFRADFGLFYNVPRNIGALFDTTNVMDTYVFRALMERGNIAMSSAAALLQSVVCLVSILATNYIVKKISPEHTLF